MKKWIFLDIDGVLNNENFFLFKVSKNKKGEQNECKRINR
jgi:histidinol phosphatase-like enzyme